MRTFPFIRSIEIIDEAIIAKDEYPFILPVVKHLQKIEFHKHVTFFIGENGTGKSTLLEAIATHYGFNPEGGSKHSIFSTQETHSPLSRAIRMAKGVKRPTDGYFLRAESFYNVATYLDQLQKEGGDAYGSYGGTSLHEQSHGESFLSLFMHRFFGNGLYILDEPEAALSPQRQLSLLVRMHELVRSNSQFIIATHSPMLLSYPQATIIQISEKGFEEIAYKDTEQYKLYTMFLNNPDYMLTQLGIV